MRIGLLSALTGLLGGCSGQQLLNGLTPTNGYSRSTNIVYAPAQNLKLDVYTPYGSQNAPVVVFFYGGRWSEGSKDLYEFVGAALAKQGFVAVLPDYRLYPQVKFPAFVEDSAQAVRWAHENAARYGGDVGRVFVMGHSAGAYNAAMLAADESYLSAVGGSRLWLSGMIGLAGPYDFMPITDPDLKDMFGPPERYADTQPINHVDGRNPPLLLLHGENDESVWPKNTRNFAAKVRAAGGPVETVIYPKMTHGWIVATLSQPLQGQSDVMTYVKDFVLRKSGLKPDPLPPTLPAAEPRP
ncbi:MAG: alpha/beta hydrolase [Nevskiaceae bacterium]|nr:MAG: alpha/beta hydrolase [Nevskiaceae bacterium]TAM33352.1 MAG: alpha/beta hydrolase [Nevskiaceae bacterium]